MNLQWFHVIFALLINVNALSEANIQASIELTGLEYEDACYETTQSQWNFMKNSSSSTLQSWVNASIKYGLYKCNGKNELQSSINDTISQKWLQYQCELINKPGDAMLFCGENKNEWKALVKFIADIELLKLTGNYSIAANGDMLFRKDADNLLSRSGTVADKLTTWSAWHKMLLPFTNKFSTNMQLIEKAAIMNGASDVTEYWEMLSEYKDGYNKATEYWKDISLLHSKIIQFWKHQLSKKYGSSVKNDCLPAHLLGSLKGYDWTPLALDVIPHTDIVYEIRKNFLDKSFVGENLYRLSTHLANTTLKHLPEASFFEQSDFHQQCPSKLINRCNKGPLRISTCSYPSIPNYLSAHKDIGKVMFHQISNDNKHNPILNLANRYSSLEESVAELFGILSVQPSWMHTSNLINETMYLENAQIVSLMITALDVLPRLAYYHSTDKWRIDLIKNNTFEQNDVINSWWQYRSQYENITTDSVKLPTFLDDTIITSNQPYLPKFIGTLLAFQIYDYLLESNYETYNNNNAEIIGTNKKFLKMIKAGGTDTWYNVVSKYIEFHEVRVDSLLGYFSPLEDYIDANWDNKIDALPDEIERKIEKMEDEFMINFNVSTTTTMKSNIVTVLENSTTIRSSIKNDNSQLKTSGKFEKRNDSSLNINLNSNIQVDTTIAPKTTISTLVVDGNNNSIDIGSVIKGTSKAVWALSAILIAIVVIIIIAIFGRQRCRKTPKNRRYV